MSIFKEPWVFNFVSPYTDVDSDPLPVEICDGLDQTITAQSDTDEYASTLSSNILIVCDKPEGYQYTYYRHQLICTATALTLSGEVYSILIRAGPIPGRNILFDHFI